MNTKRDILNKISKEEPYKVPEGYFDDLYYNILANKEKMPVQVNSKASPVWKWVLMPVAAIAIMAVFVLPPLFSSPEEPQVTLAGVSDEELIRAAEEFDEATLLELAAENLPDENTEELANIEEYELTEELLEP